MVHLVRLAGRDDADPIGQLLYDFNREFDEPAPAPSALAERLRRLIEGGDTLVLLAGDGPDDVCLRTRTVTLVPLRLHSSGRGPAGQT
jgi:hypothetical protein